MVWGVPEEWRCVGDIGTGLLRFLSLGKIPHKLRISWGKKKSWAHLVVIPICGGKVGPLNRREGPMTKN